MCSLAVGWPSVATGGRESRISLWTRCAHSQLAANGATNVTRRLLNIYPVDHKLSSIQKAIRPVKLGVPSGLSNERVSEISRTPFASSDWGPSNPEVELKSRVQRRLARMKRRKKLGFVRLLSLWLSTDLQRFNPTDSQTHERASEQTIKQIGKQADRKTRSN